jgi:hypothetical protein
MPRGDSPCWAASRADAATSADRWIDPCHPFLTLGNEYLQLNGAELTNLLAVATSSTAVRVHDSRHDLGPGVLLP